VVIRGNCRRFVEVKDLSRGFAGLLTVIVGSSTSNSHQFVNLSKGQTNCWV